MKYWQGKGKYQKENEFIMQNLVPARGEADNKDVELVRLLNRYVYDMYNNGLCNMDVLEDWFNDLVHEALKIPLTDKAKKHIELLKETLEAFDKNKTLEAYPPEEYETCLSCGGTGILEDEECEECLGSGEVLSEDEEMSEQEEHEYYVLNPLTDKLIADEDGVSELCDSVLEYALSVPFISEKVKEGLK